MNELVTARPTSTTLAVAMGAAMMSGHLQYPPRVEPYAIQQVRSTHSDFMESMASRSSSGDQFAQQIAAIYSSLAQRQERLGAEFEAAIFSDLEGLYEA
jgi:hypothetical protein